jgi:hypothetical protein
MVWYVTLRYYSTVTYYTVSHPISHACSSCWIVISVVPEIDMNGHYVSSTTVSDHYNKCMYVYIIEFTDLRIYLFPFSYNFQLRFSYNASHFFSEHRFTVARQFHLLLYFSLNSAHITCMTRRNVLHFL